MGDQLNGLDLQTMAEIVGQIQQDPGTAEPLNHWSARFRWLGGFKGQAFLGNHSFVVDEPANLAGKDSAPNAVEYLLGAFGACLSVGFILNATKRGIAVRNLEFALDGTIDNILTFLGFSNEGHPGFSEIVVKAYVDSDAEEKTLQEIWEETVSTSPVGNTLTRSVAIRPELARV